MRAQSSISALAMALLLSAFGCAGEEPEGEPTATLEIPLVRTGPDGVSYRLNASFEVTGPTETFVVDGNIDEPSVVLELVPGVHQVLLLDGWTLEQSSGGGGYFEANAILASVNPTAIRVVPNRSVSVGFTFFVINELGMLTIDFGVNTAPRQLSGGIAFTEGTQEFIDYSLGAVVDTQIFFEATNQDLVTEEDGSRTRVVSPQAVALRFYNDPFGALAPVAETFNGGFLTFTTRVRPDATQEFEMDWFSLDGQYELTMGVGPNTILTVIDEDGFPGDAFFFSNGNVVELRRFDEIVLRGTLISIRHFIDSNPAPF
jgi:hypothetical protein